MRRILSFAGCCLILGVLGASAQPTGEAGPAPMVDKDTSDPVLKPIFDAMRARGACLARPPLPAAPLLLARARGSIAMLE